MPKTQKKQKAGSPSELRVLSNSVSTTDFPLIGAVPGNAKEGGSGASRQVRPLEHGWQYVAPPYDFKQLNRFYHENSFNKASVDAIVECVVGYEVKLRVAKVIEESADEQEEKTGDPAQKEVATHFFRTCGDRHPFENVLKEVQRDFENTGNGYLEVARENGVPKYVYYLPADTVRIAFDRTKYEQIRGGKRAFFFPFSPENKDFSLNEVIHFYRPCSESYYYGAPDYLAALGAILGDMKARDYNLDKFESQMLASWAMVFGGAVSAKTRQEVEDFFAQKVKKGDWHKPLIFGMDGTNLKVDEAIKFQRLSEDIKDMAFTMFRKMNRDEVLAVRRVPPSRIAFFDNPRYQTSPEQSEQFRDEVVIPRQRLLEFHMNRVLQALGVTDWEMDLPIMDLTEEASSATVATAMVNSQSCTRNEIRKRFGLDPLSPEEGGEELVKPQAAGGQPGAEGAPQGGPGNEGVGGLMQMLAQKPRNANPAPGTKPSAVPVAKSQQDEEPDGAIAKALGRLEKRLSDLLGR